jgi:hypothetical protein
MNYSYELENGQHLEFRNEGNQTLVSFGNSSPGQQQSQGSGFTTGGWSKEPFLFRLQDQLILEIHTNDGNRFLRVDGNQSRSLTDQPDLSQAKQLPLKTSSGEHGMKPMEPMKPMAPMKPMRPMGT